MTDMGEAHYILGLKITRNRSKLGSCAYRSKSTCVGWSSDTV